MLKCGVVGRGVSKSKTPEILLKSHGITSCNVYDYAELFANVAEQMKKDHDILFITSPFKDLFGGNVCVRGVIHNTDLRAFERAYGDLLYEALNANPRNTLIVGGGYLGTRINDKLFNGRAEVLGRDDEPRHTQYYAVINTVPESKRVLSNVETDVAIDLNYIPSLFLQDFLTKGAACQSGINMLEEVVRYAVLLAEQEEYQHGTYKETM